MRIVRAISLFTLSLILVHTAMLKATYLAEADQGGFPCHSGQRVLEKPPLLRVMQRKAIVLLKVVGLLGALVSPLAVIWYFSRKKDIENAEILRRAQLVGPTCKKEREERMLLEAFEYHSRLNVYEQFSDIVHSDNGMSVQGRKRFVADNLTHMKNDFNQSFNELVAQHSFDVSSLPERPVLSSQ